MHEALQSKIKPEAQHEDSLQVEALRVSQVQSQLQRPETFAWAHDQCTQAIGGFDTGHRDTLIDTFILYVINLLLKKCTYISIFIMKLHTDIKNIFLDTQSYQAYIQ